MRRFEKDVSEGKDVTLEEYAVPTSKDYTNSLTRRTNQVSIGVNRMLKSGIEKIFRIIGNFTSE